MALHRIGKGFRMSARLLAFFLLSSASCIAAATCPPPLTNAQLRAYAEEGEVSGYVVLRWLKCGWPATVPVLEPVARLTREKAREEADPEDPDSLLESDELLEGLSMMAMANPDGVVKLFAEGDEEPDEDDVPAFAELLRLQVPPAQIASHFEQGVLPAIAWLREHYAVPSGMDGGFELARIAAKVRRGDIDGARAHLADAEPRYSVPDAVAGTHADLTESWQEMRVALAEPVAQSLAASGPGIRIDRSTPKQAVHPRKCGTGALMAQTFGLDYLRGHVLRAAPIDIAIGELLSQWREPISGGGGEHFDLLVELLRKRYGRAELQQGFGDAIAMLRNDENVVGMNLFGHFIVLPGSVLEDDAAAPDGVRERRLENHELAEIVRGTQLFRAVALPPGA
jgi:hypothetical protein